VGTDPALCSSFGLPGPYPFQRQDHFPRRVITAALMMSIRAGLLMGRHGLDYYLVARVSWIEAGETRVWLT
jgi:hypothetical protein